MYQTVQRYLLALVAALGLLAGGIALAEETVTEPSSGTDSTLSASDQVEEKISLNSATAQELSTHLRGIGAKKAEAIVEYREKYGAFTSIEQLQEVPGIGPALLARNQARLKL
ncbi:MAG: ComEA family DNA-binding protein [Enterobacteriaceae bacterium]